MYHGWKKSLREAIRNLSTLKCWSMLVWTRLTVCFSLMAYLSKFNELSSSLSSLPWEWRYIFLCELQCLIDN